MKSLLFVLTLILCVSISYWQNVDSFGIKPVANAGLNQEVSLKTKSVELKGDGIDMDGTIVSYHWTQVYGDIVVVSNPGLSKTTVKGFNDWGVYIFKLTVTDNMGNTDSDNVTITVNKYLK